MLPTLQHRFGVERLGVYGSQARGEARPESDVDVLIAFRPEAHTYDNLFDVREMLREKMGADVDVTTVEGLSRHVRPYAERDLVWL